MVNTKTAIEAMRELATAIHSIMLGVDVDPEDDYSIHVCKGCGYRTAFTGVMSSRCCPVCGVEVSIR